MTTRPTTKVILLVLLAAVLTLPVSGGDWPQWRGPKRDGISNEKGLLVAWPKTGPKVVWKATGLGEGYSGFSVTQGKVFTMGQRKNEEYVLALDAATGNKAWEKVITSGVYNESHGNGPRGTPTIDGNRLYAEAADGTLVCLEVTTGKEIWKKSFTEDFGGSVPHWGFSESPLIDGNNLIATPGGKDATIVALNKMTGKVVWKSPVSDPAGYASPILITTGGVRQIVNFTAKGVIGVRADNGTFLWRYDKAANRTANIATPIYLDGYLYVSSGYGTGCALLKLEAAGETVTATEVYFSKDMQNHYSTSVVLGDTVYGFNQAILTAMDLKTGEVKWRDRSVGKGSVTLVGDKLYLMGEDGTAALAEATPAGYKEISRFTIPKSEWPTYAPLVVTDGRMYQREQDNVYCYDIKAGSAE